MASTDAAPICYNQVPFRLYFDWRKNDGTLLTGAAGVTSQISKDGAAFASTTNTVTEISGGGVYFLDLTGAETTVNCLVVKVTSTTTGAVPAVETIYPAAQTQLKVNTTYIGSSITPASTMADLYNNSIITGYVDTTNPATASDFYVGLDNISANLATDYFKGRSIVFTGIGASNFAGQAARILGYTYAVPFGHITVTTLTGAPPTNARFAII